MVFRSVSPSLRAYRYPVVREATTPGDVLTAVVGQLRFLTSRDYVTELLHEKHGVPKGSGSKRAGLIVSHVESALQYVEQAYAGPADISFLPAYYSILNLVKTYVLFSTRHADLPAHRWHGAQYRGFEKDSRSLLTEEITIKRGGALPLFYSVLTGKPWSRDTRVVMRDVYPFIADAAAEWQIATGLTPRIAGILGSVTSTSGRELELTVTLPRGIKSARRKELPCLRKVRQDPANPLRYTRSIPDLSETPQEMMVRAVAPLFIYYPHDDRTIVALHSGRTTIFEEWPIALAYFHLSSVVRYNPEFHSRLRDSRHWPVVTALRDAHFRFLVLTWSFVQQSTMVFKSR